METKDRIQSASSTGAAWLSSARAVRCRLKWFNERNPRLLLLILIHVKMHSKGTAHVKWEEGGDDVKSAWPLCPGLHTCYNGVYRGMPSRKVEQIPKSTSQFGLRAAICPHEAGIASNGVSATMP